MINNKIEITITLLLFFIIFYIFDTITKSFSELFILSIAYVLIWYIIFSIYRKITSRNFIIKVYKFVYDYKFDEALSCIDKAIKNKPEFTWLFQQEKAIIIALSGNYKLFLSLADSLIYPKKRFESSSYYRFIAIKYMMDFLLGNPEADINPVYLNSKKWEKYIKGYELDLYMAVNKFQNKDFTEAINISNKLNSMNFNFLKFVAHVILMKSYNEINDIKMANTYKDELYQDSRFEKYIDIISHTGIYV